MNASGTSFDQTVAALSGFGGSITNSDFIATRTLTVNQITDTSFSGTFTGTLGLTKSGPGILQLLGANTHTGDTTISGGTLDLGTEFVHGTLTGNVIVQAGGRLTGFGTMGRLTAQSNGTIAPGNPAGILTTANLALQAGSTLALNLGKSALGVRPVAGTDFDQLSVTDSTGGVTPTITLAGALSVQAGGNIEHDDIFTILLNNSSDPISGTFLGLPQGSIVIALAGIPSFQISYFDDASTPAFEVTGGNDVSLRAIIPEPSAATLLLASLCTLTGLRRRRAA